MTDTPTELEKLLAALLAEGMRPNHMYQLVKTETLEAIRQYLIKRGVAANAD